MFRKPITFGIFLLISGLTLLGYKYHFKTIYNDICGADTLDIHFSFEKSNTLVFKFQKSCPDKMKSILLTYGLNTIKIDVDFTDIYDLHSMLSNINSGKDKIILHLFSNEEVIINPKTIQLLKELPAELFFEDNFYASNEGINKIIEESGGIAIPLKK